MPTLLGISRILVVWIQFVCHTIQFGSQILFFTISKYLLESLLYYIFSFFLLQSTQTTYANFIYFSNSADSTYNSAIINTNVIVSSSGEITWLSHGIYKSSCDIDVEYFPFDVQICKLMWASWTYDGQSVRTFMLFLLQNFKY